MGEARKDVADALCKDCALCCDGTFFGSVVIAKEERSRIGRLGLLVVDRDGALLMPQSCQALRGCLCSVYEGRPRACASYECPLRLRILSGQTSDASARDSLGRMRVLLATIREAFDLGDGSIWDTLVAIEGKVPTSDPMTPAARKFDRGIAAVGELLELSQNVFEPALGGPRAGESGSLPIP